MPIQKENTSTQHCSSDLPALLQDVLQRTKLFGASDAMVSVEQDEGYSVDVRMGEVDTVSFNEDKGISLTVYFGHRKGSASSTDTSGQALDAMVKAACEIAKVSAEDSCFGLADKELTTTVFADLDLYHPWDLQPADAIKMALSCEGDALGYDARISNSDGVNISTYNFYHGFANTYGGQGVLRGSRHSVSCALIAQEGSALQRDYEYSTARNARGLNDLKTIAHNAAKNTLIRLGARKIKTQKVPIIFSPRVSSGILSSFINAISGSNLYRKNSFLLDNLGKQIFPKKFTIYEQPHLHQALGSAPFDGEGVVTRNNIFVEDGILQQYVLSSYPARRMGLTTTANSGGVHNLTLDATAQDWQTMIKSMKKGLVVTELMGQGVNVLTGNYSRGATGFWVENGAVQFPVEEITIAGNLKDMFSNIAAVGNDINTNIATRCGSIWIDNMTVGGQ